MVHTVGIWMDKIRQCKQYDGAMTSCVPQIKQFTPQTFLNSHNSNRIYSLKQFASRKIEWNVFFVQPAPTATSRLLFKIHCVYLLLLKSEMNLMKWAASICFDKLDQKRDEFPKTAAWQPIEGMPLILSIISPPTWKYWLRCEDNSLKTLSVRQIVYSVFATEFSISDN